MKEPKIYSLDSSLIPEAAPKDGFCVDLVSFGDYEVLKAERDAQHKRADALAVENAALKDAITTHSQSTHFCELCGKDDPCSTDDVCYALNETPATSAALAAIEARGEARGVEKLADKLDAEIEQIMRGAFFYDDISSREAISKMVREFANELREAK